MGRGTGQCVSGRLLQFVFPFVIQYTEQNVMWKKQVYHSFGSVALTQQIALGVGPSVCV